MKKSNPSNKQRKKSGKHEPLEVPWTLPNEQRGPKKDPPKSETMKVAAKGLASMPPNVMKVEGAKEVPSRYQKEQHTAATVSSKLAKEDIASQEKKPAAISTDAAAGKSRGGPANWNDTSEPGEEEQVSTFSLSGSSGDRNTTQPGAVAVRGMNGSSVASYDSSRDILEEGTSDVALRETQEQEAADQGYLANAVLVEEHAIVEATAMPESNNDKEIENEDDASNKRRYICIAVALAVLLSGIVGTVVGVVLRNSNDDDVENKNVNSNPNSQLDKSSSPTFAPTAEQLPSSMPSDIPTSTPTDIPSITPTISPPVPTAQVVALQKLFDTTRSQFWVFKENWGEGDPCMNNWEKVACGPGSNIVELDLFYNNLYGSIPTEIGQLTKLKRLNLNSNDIFGRLPTELGRLTDLEYISLTFCGVEGQIPTEIGRMTSLTAIDFNYNSLTGSIPTEIGNLKNALSVNLLNNDLIGSMPEEACSLRDNTEPAGILVSLLADCKFGDQTAKISCPILCCTNCL